MMFDTIPFNLSKYDVKNTSFLEETTNYLTNVTNEGSDIYGNYVIGYLDTLNVMIRENFVKIKKGSFCKWYLGSNLVSMKRKDVQLGVEKLSDETKSKIALEFENAAIECLVYKTAKVIEKYKIKTSSFIFKIIKDICKNSQCNFFAKVCQTNIKKIYCTFDIITIVKNEDLLTDSRI